MRTQGVSPISLMRPVGNTGPMKMESPIGLRKAPSFRLADGACPPSEEMPCDETLLHEIVELKSEPALEQLYLRYRSVLRSVVMRVIRDESEADDVLQDVFVQVWTQGHHYSAEKGRVLGWLIILARRRALDRLRQRCAYQRASDRFEAEYKHPPGGAEENRIVDREVCSKDLRDLMCRLIGKLPPHQGQVIRLTFFEDMSQREIAARLGLPLGTVKTRIELGVRKLCNALLPMREKVA